MTIDLDFKFAIVSDLHVALPETILDDPRRFHWVEIGIPALDAILDRLSSLDLDFILLPGDLTQDGEKINHRWLSDRLAKLPIPSYVIPGNHDLPSLDATSAKIGVADFPSYYRHCGYGDGDRCYYSKEILPGVRIIGLNSQQFDSEGKQTRGYIDREQLDWLELTLAADPEIFTLVMVHHNVLEHFPDQTNHSIGKRYILANSPELIELLDRYRVRYVFTGHLHIQDIARTDRLYDITTGSLIGYPHPYRLCHYHQDRHHHWLEIESEFLPDLPDCPELQAISRQKVKDRSTAYLLKMLVEPPLNFSPISARRLVPHLREFWADVAAGDTLFEFTDLPPHARSYFESFGAVAADGSYQSIDNHVGILD
jgi:3',5'-cyclic AMP phosphodiesterase CpdA